MDDQGLFVRVIPKQEGKYFSVSSSSGVVWAVSGSINMVNGENNGLFPIKEKCIL